MYFSIHKEETNACQIDPSTDPHQTRRFAPHCDVTVVGATPDELTRLQAHLPSPTTTAHSLRAHALNLTALGDDDLRKLIADNADVVLSLLPAPLHPRVARACLAAKAHLVTSSYVSAELRALDTEARGRGLVFLNEAGLDPGCVGGCFGGWV